MYTVHIVANQEIISRKFACIMAACDYIKDTAGLDLCALQSYGEIVSGRGVIRCHQGAFVTLARLI